MADDVVVHLPGAEHEAADPLVPGRGIVDHREEGALREVAERRGGLLEAEQPLRGHHDERPRRCVESLPAKKVEVLGRRRAVRDADVLLGCELEEALETGARVLGAVPLVPVRQQQGQP